MYAVYANCDPLTAEEIQRNGQVLLYYVTDKLHHLKGMSGFMSACIFAGSLRYSVINNYSTSARWIRVGYNHLISSKGEWNNCFIN